MKIFLMILTLVTFASASAEACSFLPLGISIGNTQAVTEAMMADEDMRFSMIESLAFEGGIAKAVMVGEGGAKKTVVYEITWTDTVEDGIDCPSPKAKRLN